MSAERIMQEIKEALSGRPGQPIVLGVCQALASKLGREAWCVRLTVIVMVLFWTLPILIAYIIMGFVMDETAERSRGFFAGLAVLLREWAEKGVDVIGQIFGSSRASDNRGY